MASAIGCKVWYSALAHTGHATHASLIAVMTKMPVVRADITVTEDPKAERHVPLLVWRKGGPPLLLIAVYKHANNRCKRRDLARSLVQEAGKLGLETIIAGDWNEEPCDNGLAPSRSVGASTPRRWQRR